MDVGSSSLSRNQNSGLFGELDSALGMAFIGTTANDEGRTYCQVWDRKRMNSQSQPGFESPKRDNDTHTLPYEVNVIGLYTAFFFPDLFGRDDLGFPVGDGVDTAGSCFNSTNRGRRQPRRWRRERKDSW